MITRCLLYVANSGCKSSSPIDFTLQGKHWDNGGCVTDSNLQVNQSDTGRWESLCLIIFKPHAPLAACLSHHAVIVVIVVVVVVDGGGPPDVLCCFEYFTTQGNIFFAPKFFSWQPCFFLVLSGLLAQARAASTLISALVLYSGKKMSFSVPLSVQSHAKV